MRSSQFRRHYLYCGTLKDGTPIMVARERADATPMVR